MTRPWTLRLLSIVFGLGILALAEASLRWIGWFDDSPQDEIEWPDGMQPAYGLQSTQMFVEDNGQVEIHPSLIDSGFVQPRRFAVEPSAKRVFTFGGSATLGVPFEDLPAKTWPGKVQHLFGLMDVDSEVVNLGGASFGSAHVREFAAQSLAYKPDALLIYAGNNEFFNYGLELLANNQGLLKHQGYIEELHVLRLLSTALGGEMTQSVSIANLKQQQDQRIAEIVGEILLREQEKIDVQTPKRQDRIMQEVQRRYVDNLHNVALLAADNDIPVLIALLPINLEDPPWLSLHTSKISLEQKNLWFRYAQAARQAAAEQQWSEARALWSEAIQIDPLPAEGWYGMGTAKKAMQMPFEDDLLRALQLDFHAGRPTPELIEALRRHKWPENVLLVDFTAPFSNQPEKLFHDSCHLTEEGNRVVAEGFVDRMVAELGWGFSTLSK